MVSGDVSRIGDVVVINLSLLDVAGAAQVARAGSRVSARKSIQKAFDELGRLVEELAAGDPLVTGKLVPRARRVGHRGFRVGLRGEGEVLGLGYIGGVHLGFRDRWWGVGTVLFVRPWTAPSAVTEPRPFAARLEVRLHPFDAGPISPYLGIGATSLIPETAARAALGFEVIAGPIVISVDGAYERLLQTDTPYRTDHVLVALGFAWRS